MARYTVWVVSPPGYIHSRCFYDVALALSESIRTLGHECFMVTSSMETRGRTIILGAHLINFMHVRDLPEDIIIYNLEQITPGSPWLSQEYINLLRGIYNGYALYGSHRFELWDYSVANIEEMKKIKFGPDSKRTIDARLCCIGYSPCLSRIEERVEDIDVLFYGSMNPRREYVLNLLRAKGVKVHHAFGAYGFELDQLIARSKIVLNMHFYDSKVFEIVRCSYLMANKKFIVSELGGDPSMETPFADAIAFAHYNDLAATCMKYLADDSGRKQKAQAGFDIFSQMRQSKYLGDLL